MRTIAHTLDTVIAEARARERELTATIAAIPEPRRESARNLVHYLAMRSFDLRVLQDHLAALGLSSLGRAEVDALGSLLALRAVVARIEDGTTPLASAELTTARARLLENATALLGPVPKDRPTRVMVTLPSSAATDLEWTEVLVAAGVEIVRINCAHDGPEQWLEMIANVRAAARAAGRRVLIQADLAGPKLRTGTTRARRDVLRFRPLRNRFGAPVSPVRIPLRMPGDPGIGVGLVTDAIGELREGDVLVFQDARGRRRRWAIERREHLCATCDRTSYVRAGIVAEVHREGIPCGRVAFSDELVDDGLPLDVGDRLRLVDENELGRFAGNDPPAVGFLAPSVFEHVCAGQRILFDDGKLGGVIEAVERDGLLVRITQTRPGGATLRADRGINLPDSDLHLGIPVERDREALAALVAEIDLVGLSFVENAVEVAELRRLLSAAGRHDVGLVLKIETRHAFERLPELLFAALANGPAGVMVARGDLAVEIGFERLAEVQEEILWLCEAAHVPCIWATQVLDTLARTGSPTRAEVTDAAMGARAECVMLNKGPFVLDAVRTLVDVLRRMEAHHTKKRSLLRRLAVSRPPGADP